MAGNPYLDFFEERESQRQRGDTSGLAATATLAHGVNPEAVANARKTAQFLGVPPAAVEATPEESERQARIRKLEVDTEAAPTLRRQYTNADFMKLAGDDSGVLSGIEATIRRMMDPPRKFAGPKVDAVTNSVGFSDAVRRQMQLNPALDADAARALVGGITRVDNVNQLAGESRGPAPSVASVARGLFSLDRFRTASAGMSVAAADLLGIDPAQSVRRYDVAKSRADLNDPEFETATGKGLYSGGVSLVNNSPGLVLSIITGNPAPALALAGGQVSAEAYGKYRSRGATPGQAAAGAGLEGGIEVATELLPMRFMVDKLGKAGATEFMKGLLAREIPGEQLATLAQDAVDTAIANPDKTWGQYVAERPDAAYQTLLATLVQTGAMGTASAIAQKVAPERAAQADAERTAQTMAELAQLMEASKLRGRDASEFTAFVQQIAESGETPTELYVDAQQLAGVLNQSGVDLQALRSAAPTLVAQLEQEVPGADVRVPVAELAALGPEFTTPLLDHLREAPEAMSRTEAAEFLASGEGNKIRSEVERLLAERQDGAAFQEQVKAATEQIEQQLNTVARFRPEVNKAYAGLLGNFYAVQAMRAGTTLEDMMSRYGLRIVGQTKAGALLDQFVPVGGLRQGPVETPAFRQWFGGSKAVDAGGKPLVVYHGSPDMRFLDEDGVFATMKDRMLKYGATPESRRDAKDKRAFFFTTSQSVARTYADPHRAFDYQAAEEGVIPVFLALTNPMVFDADGKHWREAQAQISKEDFIVAAKKAGHDGVVIRNVRDSYDSMTTGRDPLSDVFVAFDSKQIKHAERNDGTFDADDPNILSQAEAEVTRGSFDPSTNTLALLAAADLSTFIHESGHFFLEVQADLAARIQTAISRGDQVSEGEQQIVRDMDQILNWFGVRGDGNMSALDRWATMTLDEKREHHESWARGFERYVMEGKAPSQELQTLFARFRAWLVSVYKTLAGLNVVISDDVRSVMDRMLASDQAIAQAQAARTMGPLFQTPEQAGMTLEEFQAYQALGERATAAASAELDARLLKDMRWLSRARDKALKEAQATAAAARAEVEQEVRAEVMAEPIYRAWAFLTGKADQLLPGTVAPADMTGLESGRLRTKFVKEIDPAAYERLSKLRMTSEERGLDPDIVAEIFGFASGEQLVKTLAITPAPSKVVDELTDFRTLQRHGDITSPEALERAADEAVHNELRARVIANELKALAKAGKVTESGDSLYKNRDVVNVMARAAEQYAAQVIARQQIRALRPKQYAAAEARSAKLASQALGKSTEEAAMHKRNQLVNNYATKAAYAAQAEVRKGVEFFRKVMRGSRDDIAKTRDWDMVQAARAVLASYGMGTKGEAAQKYLDAVAQYDPEMARMLREKVDVLTAGAKPLNQLTVEEFRGLLEEIQSLWYLAKRSRQVEIDGQLIDIERAKIPLVEQMEAIGIPATVPGEGRAVTDGERRIARLRSAAAALRRVEAWAQAKDGSQAMGPFRRYLWQPIKDAADRYRTDKAKFLGRYRDLLASLDVGRSRIEAPELVYTFGYSRGGSGKAEILHALLHTGNASNKRKLLLGRQWATENADGTLDTARWDGFVKRMVDTGVLTKADYDFAQGVWDLLEEMKPLAQKTHRDVFGRYFDEVTADPFDTPFGSYRGGYVPAMTDAEVVKDAATRALQEDENQTLAFAFPSTNRGFTKGRVEYNAPLLLDLRTLSQHIDKVLLFSHLEQPIREVRRIVTSKAVSQPLHRIDPAAFDGILTPWMNRAARQSVETKVPGDNGLMRFFSKVRSRAGMAAMFANVINTAQQVTGFSVALLRTDAANLRRAMVDYAVAPRQFARAVAEASPYMASRMENEVAAMNDAIDSILLNPSVYESAQAWFAQHAYFMQSAVDNVMSPIVWTAAYNKHLEAGLSELDARRLADAAVRQTQGSTLAEDVSRIETGNAFVRMFTQFAGYFNMLANTMGTDFAVLAREQGLRKGMGRGFYVFLFGFMVPAMVSELIVQAGRGGPDDEDKDGVLDDWLQAVLLTGPARTALAMVPGVGQVANAGFNTWNNKPYDDRISTAPAISMIESAVKAPYDVYKAVTDDGSVRKAVRDVATLIALTTGIPATAIARPGGYLADVEQGRVAPASTADAVRGAVTGAASPESKQR
jgi:hypothetical protein